MYIYIYHVVIYHIIAAIAGQPFAIVFGRIPHFDPISQHLLHSQPDRHLAARAALLLGVGAHRCQGCPQSQSGSNKQTTLW